MRHIESKLQQGCKRWFDLRHPKLARLLFAVPNGYMTTPSQARIARAEGLTAGVSDMVLLVPRGGYASLCIEFKTEKGRQTDLQRSWQWLAEANGNRYVVCRSLPEFIAAVEDYLAPEPTRQQETPQDARECATDAPPTPKR